jgi:hypothetical protein
LEENQINNNLNMIPMTNNIIFKNIILNNKKAIYEESKFMA